MDLFTREIHNVFNEELAKELYPTCREILDNTKEDSRYLFGKTTFWQQSIMKENMYKFENFFPICETNVKRFKPTRGMDSRWRWFEEVGDFGDSEFLE